MLTARPVALSSKRKRNIVKVEMKYSLGWPELEGNKVLVTPPVGGSEPSDSHLAVFLDDIGNYEIFS